MWSEFNDKTKTAGTSIMLLAVLCLFDSISPLLAATPAECEARLNLQSNQPDINFGTMMEYGAGTVTVTPGGARSATGGVVLLGGTVNAARFRIRVNQDACIQNPLCITLPDTPLTGPGTDMPMTNIVVDIPQIPFAGTLPTQINLPERTWVDVYIGADLNVNAGQAAGNYSGTFDVTFTYLNCP
jgi:hypothetical protein